MYIIFIAIIVGFIRQNYKDIGWKVEGLSQPWPCWAYDFSNNPFVTFHLN
jgi:hypothetical protein